ncbi:FTR1 family protein [Paenibacillus sp. MBLB4367]|uniref:FTR1 family iron permease n=1 Tax=Paenibacillus sp. MBLB4367 TaxID=3384767 RepID=UPI003907F5A6
MNRRASRSLIEKLLLLAFVLLLLTGPGGQQASAADTGTAGADRLMPLAGGALVEAGQKHWAVAKQEVEQFDAEWKKLNPPSSPSAAKVAEAIAQAIRSLNDAEAHPDEAYQAVSRLTKATDEYAASVAVTKNKKDGKEAVQSLLPYLKQTLDQVKQSNWTEASARYKQFTVQWGKIEPDIRNDNPQVYGLIETMSSRIRIALQTDPPQAAAAESGITALMQTVNDYRNGTLKTDASNAGTGSIADLIAILDMAHSEAGSDRADGAAEQMQAFIALWPSLEGEVRTRSQSTYANIENEMTQVSGYLMSKPPRTTQALAVIAGMRAELEPYTKEASYTAWDAGLILLREGLEALLVVAALLAFLQRTGNGSKQKWIWSGAAAGLVASAMLAIVLTLTIAKAASGSARELIEGVTGLVSVILMITVGVWMHGKSNVNAWNSYIQSQMGSALASGRLWYLFLIAGLAILREGAETAIFYIGMAPSIEPFKLVLGIAVALAVLAISGIAIVKGGARLPVRPFFLAATVFIYYLVIKFLGQSIHSLQIAGKLAAHSRDYLLSMGWLGVYPTWETSAPQLLALLFIAILFMRTAYKNRNGSGSARTA